MSAPPGKFRLALLTLLICVGSSSADAPEPKAKLSHDGPVNVVAFSPDGTMLAAGDRDSTIRLWHVASRKVIHKLKIADGEFLSLSFAPDGKTLASTSNDGWIRLWDVEKGTQIREFHARDRLPRSYVAFAPDGKTLASGAGDGIVSIWDPATAKEIYSSKPWGAVHSIAYLTNSQVVAAGSRVQRSQNGTSIDLGVRLIDSVTGKELREFNPPDTCLAISPDGKSLAASGSKRAVIVVELATGQERTRFKGIAAACAFSPDSRFLAIADTKDHFILVYDQVTNKAVLRLEEHEAEVTSLAFSSDGKLLASAAGDLSVLLWDMSNLPRTVQPVPLAEAALKAHWVEMLNFNSVRAYEARNALVHSPEQAVPFLKKILHNPDDRPRFADLIRDLDSDKFPVRQKATQEIERMGKAAEPALRRLLDKKPSLEVCTRIEQLLDRIAAPKLTADQIRTLRAIEVLELIDTPQARAALKELAKSEPPSFLSLEAEAAVKRKR